MFFWKKSPIISKNQKTHIATVKQYQFTWKPLTTCMIGSTIGPAIKKAFGPHWVQILKPTSTICSTTRMVRRSSWSFICKALNLYAPNESGHQIVSFCKTDEDLEILSNMAPPKWKPNMLFRCGPLPILGSPLTLRRPVGVRQMGGVREIQGQE